MAKRATNTTTATEAVTAALRWHVLQTWVWSEHPEPSVETLDAMRGHTALGAKCLAALACLIGKADADAIYAAAQRTAKRELGIADEAGGNGA